MSNTVALLKTLNRLRDLELDIISQVKSEEEAAGTQGAHLATDAVLQIIPLHRKAYSIGKPVLLVGLKPNEPNPEVTSRLYEFCAAHTWKTDLVLRLSEDTVILVLPGVAHAQAENLISRLANDFYRAYPGSYSLDFVGSLIQDASEAGLASTLAGLWD